MNYLTTQITLAARGDDVEGWTQMLVFLMVAVFWVIGGIIKARTKKTDQEDQDQPTPEPPRMLRTSKRKRLQEILYGETQRPTARTPHERPGPQIPSLQPDVKEPQRFVSKSAKKLEDKYAGIPAPAETHEAEPAIGSLLDFSDVDELKKAILHYEILGKPIALRKPD